MSDGEFLRAVCKAAGTGILLDVENVYVNAHNHGFDANTTLAEIPAGLVRGMHMAGGSDVGAVLVDSHDHAVPDGALDLLGRALARFRPDTVVLERDDRIEEFDEILADVERIRSCLARPPEHTGQQSSSPNLVSGRAPDAVPLIERQRALLAFLTNPRAALGAVPLAGLDDDRLRLMRDLSVGKRLDKVRSCFPVTLAHLDEPLEPLCADFVIDFPPYDIGRAENAQQFSAFLAQRWERTPPRRAYVRDLVRIELALTLARRPFEDGAAGSTPAARPAVRCSPGAQFLHCSHDVRALFDQAPDAFEPVKREVWLVVLPPARGDEHADGTPRILEVSAELYAALLPLDEWRPFDGADPLGIGAPEEVAEHLLDLGILEVAE